MVDTEVAEREESVVDTEVAESVVGTGVSMMATEVLMGKEVKVPEARATGSEAATVVVVVCVFSNACFGLRLIFVPLGYRGRGGSSGDWRNDGERGERGGRGRGGRGRGGQFHLFLLSRHCD